jgi:hypothetical protein
MAESDAIIERYRAAYEAANRKPSGEIVYLKGWYVWADRFKKRKAQIIAMTKTLEDRAIRQDNPNET